MDVGTRLSPFLDRLLGERTPLHVTFWDGSTWGPDDASARLVVRSPNALKRITQAPGELGFGRAYVAGDLDVEGDIYDALALRHVRGDLTLTWREKLAMLRAALAVGAFSLRRIAPPPEEARLRGRVHSRARDAAAIAHHYDVSNDFYRMVLGPTLTYSCAYFATAESTLEDAQRDKHELVCRKLRLREGERVLDVGCGWGTFAIHAATRHGARVVGVTLSHSQAELASKRVADAGVADRVEIRVQDERDVSDGPYDAIASIGMFEHVGAARLRRYFEHLYELLRPQGRLLNHGISRPAGGRPGLGRNSFIDSYVFPDGELHEVGAVVSTMQHAGFEVRDVESLREHYALTLRRWVADLERDRDAALTHVSEGRYRVWRLYMAASALNFEAGRTQIHQVLAVKSTGGVSGVPLRRSDIVL
jgi:cyclopropane-fatty-acyl-phospholipid synthase